METKNLDDLKANPDNPRTIDKHDYEALVRSIKKFGDLSGIVFNVTTGQLVGGHQRTEAFKRMGGDKKVIITQRFPEPNAKGTIALGYVDFENEQYSYREVQWDADFEKAANIAANRIQGNFDLDLLAKINYELAQLENADELLEATGQTDDELERLMKSIGAVSEDEPNDENSERADRLEFSLTREQREIVEEALGHIKAKRELPAESNSSLNGAALYVICRDYLDELHGLKDAPEAPVTNEV